MTASQCLAENVRYLRRGRKFTQAKLAKLAGVSLPTVQLIEGEKRWPERETLSALARALEVEETRLFFDRTLRWSRDRALLALQDALQALLWEKSLGSVV